MTRLVTSQNNRQRLIGIVLCMLVIIFIKGCGSDNESNEDPIPAYVLSGKTLTLVSASVDGIDKTNLYSGLTLQFENTAYQSTNGYPFFNPIGTWRVLPDAHMIEFDGVFQSQVAVTSDDLLRFTYEWRETTFGDGRLSSIEGTYQLEFRIR